MSLTSYQLLYPANSQQKKKYIFVYRLLFIYDDSSFFIYDNSLLMRIHHYLSTIIHPDFLLEIILDLTQICLGSKGKRGRAAARASPLS